MFNTRISQLGDHVATIQGGRITFVSDYYSLSNMPKDPVFISKLQFTATNWQDARDWVEAVLFEFYDSFLVSKDKQIGCLKLQPERFEPSMIASLEPDKLKLTITLSSSTSDLLQQVFADLLEGFRQKKEHPFLILVESVCTMTNTVRFDYKEQASLVFDPF